MGLKTSAIEILKLVSPLGSVLCLAYPDIIVDAEKLIADGVPITKTNDNGRRHGKRYKLPDPTEYLAYLGATSVRYVDIIPRDVEEVVDLNIPIDLGQYDLVIDPGTTEHCFNIAQALVNAANAVKVGGHIFHAVPASMINHGFWNFSPTVFWDFYNFNGFDVRGMWFERGNQTAPAPAAKRLDIPRESSLYCIAQRIAEVPFAIPTQGKYKEKLDVFEGNLEVAKPEVTFVNNTVIIPSIAKGLHGDSL